MAKYIIDLDSFYECLDFLNEGKANGNDYCFLQNVKALIHRFPKTKVEETINIEMKSDIKIGE